MPQPQATTVPSDFSARLWKEPAAIALTPERPLGTLHCPTSSTAQPQATTVPSDFSARLWKKPVATAVTPERPLGTLHCPQAPMPPQPQATTVPVAVAPEPPVAKISPTLSTTSAQSR